MARAAPIVFVKRQGESGTFRRLRTAEASAVLQVSRALEAFTPEQRRRLSDFVLFYDEEKHAWRPCRPGIPILFGATSQRHGKRHHFVCPVSGRRARKLYVVKVDGSHIIGCAEGLGLSYPSQAMHKTPALDAAITSWRIKVKPTVAVRAMDREQERFHKALKGFLRASA